MDWQSHSVVGGLGADCGQTDRARCKADKQHYRPTEPIVHSASPQIEKWALNSQRGRGEGDNEPLARADSVEGSHTHMCTHVRTIRPCICWYDDVRYGGGHSLSGGTLFSHLDVSQLTSVSGGMN